MDTVWYGGKKIEASVARNLQISPFEANFAEKFWAATSEKFAFCWAPFMI